jgi:D-alanyl-D-alanine carboxypeptidase
VKTRRQLQEFLNGLSTDLGLPGAVLSHRTGSAGPVSAAAGWSDIEAAEPMRTWHRLLGASIGKSFVGALCVKLSQAGVLGLDDKIGKWVGDRSWFGGLPGAQDITLKMLLNHSSGLQDHVYQPGYLEKRTRPEDPDWIVPHDDKIALVSGIPGRFAPGTGFNYTDTEYLIAGLIIERATGRVYYDLLRETLLEPFGLEFTSPSDRRRLTGLAAGYMSDNDPFRRSGMPNKVMQDGALLYHPGNEWTGGGVITNPQDLVVWAQRLFSGAVLGPEGTRQIMDAAIPEPLELPWRRYGLGAMEFEATGRLLYGHWGNMPGYSGLMCYAPTEDLAFALQVNTTVFNIHKAQDEIYAFLTGAG